MQASHRRAYFARGEMRDMPTHSGQTGRSILIARAGGDTLLEIVEAAEGRSRPVAVRCGAVPCQWDNVCPVHHARVTAGRALRDSLNATSLAEIAREDASWRNGRAHGRVAAAR
jgi:DNA-binding IscR family transcriptional regulator